jgi:hypothetical protein
MSRVRSLRFEALESKELLSAAHAAVHAARDHAKPAVNRAPLVLDGTLTVDEKAVTAAQNDAGGATMQVPVTGQLGALGKVTGDWYESTGSSGYLGPDTLTLHGAQGAISLAFNDGTPGPAHRVGPDSVFYQHPLRIQGGTGSYAGYTGSGTIDLNMNAAHSQVESITLNAQAKVRS